MKIWTPEEFARFISFVSNDEYRLLFRLLYISGCRIGEALALTPSSMDYAGSRIRIRSSITQKVYGKPYAVTTTKNDPSNRDILMTSNIMQDIKSFCEDKKRGSNDFIFGGEQPKSDNTIRNNMYKFADDAGIKRIRIHDLRHSCAFLLISQGVSIVAVSKRLGHSTVTQTLNTYSHLMPNDDLKTVGIFERV